MKNIYIKKASAKIWRAKLNTPFRTALGQHDILENVLFSVELSNGIRGFGEAAVATHITGETVQGTLGNLIGAAHEIAGRGLSEFPGIADVFASKFSKNKCALAALETALLDAHTRERGMPLWRAFGTRPRTFRTDMTVVLGTVPEAETAARGILRKGIRSFKVKIGRRFDEDIKRVIAIARIAKKCPLYLDANQGFSAVQTLKFLKELAKYKVRPALIEQPVPKKDFDGLKKVTRESKVLVLADESAGSYADAKRIIKEKAAGAINIKLMKTALLESYEIAKLAKKNGIKLMIGCMMETPLATTAAAHLVAGLGGFDFIDLDTPFFMVERVTRGSCMSPSGVYDLGKVKAGIGVTPV
jgi:L-alanine-DL-glutamate epimerase-like enolase superfamily enzyme